MLFVEDLRRLGRRWMRAEQSVSRRLWQMAKGVPCRDLAFYTACRKAAGARSRFFAAVATVDGPACDYLEVVAECVDGRRAIPASINPTHLLRDRASRRRQGVAA